MISFLVSVPSAIKVFNWTATLYKGCIHFHTPMLYALGFIRLFTIGGLGRFQQPWHGRPEFSQDVLKEVRGRVRRRIRPILLQTAGCNHAGEPVRRRSFGAKRRLSPEPLLRAVKLPRARGPSQI